MKKHFLIIAMITFLTLLSTPNLTNAQGLENTAHNETFMIGSSFDCSNTIIYSEDTLLNNFETDKTIFIQSGVTLTLTGSVTVNNDIYVFGTLSNTGILTVNGTINCLRYNSMLSAGNYDYGYFISTGRVKCTTLNVKANYLSIGIPDITHTAGDWHLSAEATCTSTGLRCQECILCGQLLESDVIPQSAHTYGDWLMIEAPTCVSSGYHEKYCLTCDDRISETLPPAEHPWGEWLISEESTCTSHGTRKRICNDCGTAMDEQLELAEHSPGNWNITTPASCSSIGHKERRCLECNIIIDTMDIPVIPHGKTTWKTTKKATCSSTGSESLRCLDCKKDIKTRAIAKKQHSYSKWKTIKKATIFKAGTKSHTCTYCKQTEQQTIKKLSAKVTLNKKSLNLAKNRSYKLKIKKKTSGDVIKTWTSSNKKIVSVNSKTGKIKARKKGTAYITVKMKSGAKAKCKVVVK